MLLWFFLPAELNSRRLHFPCNNIHILIHIPSFTVVLFSQGTWKNGLLGGGKGIPKNSKMGEDTVLAFNWLAPVLAVHRSLYADGWCLCGQDHWIFWITSLGRDSTQELYPELYPFYRSSILPCFFGKSHVAPAPVTVLTLVLQVLLTIPIASGSRLAIIWIIAVVHSFPKY